MLALYSMSTFADRYFNKLLDVSLAFSYAPFLHFADQTLTIAQPYAFIILQPTILLINGATKMYCPKLDNSLWAV